MAEEEERPQTLQERIAALNMGHVGRAPVTAQPAKRTPPQPPMRRAQTASIPTAGSQNGTDIGNEPGSGRAVLPPPEGIIRTGQRTVTNGTSVPAEAPPKYSPRLPARTNTTSEPPSRPRVPPRPPPRGDAASKPAPPSLPARRPTEPSRRDSQESIASTLSAVSMISNASRQMSGDSGRIKAPAYDPLTLPPLPIKRTTDDSSKACARLPMIASKSTTSLLNSKAREAAGQLALPPSLPRRPSAQEPIPAPSPRHTLSPPDLPSLPPRRDTQPRSPVANEQPRLPARPNGLPTPNATPPPIPNSTRPDLSKILGTKPRAGETALASADAAGCLLCRDFSAPDAHAAKFPRQEVPSLDWLATQLTSPFPSLTDKARVIFTWLHHNVDYDVEAFFNNNVQGSTPASTLSSGLAVCEGYAGLFAALATKGGLEAIVVGGHGKGYGYAPLVAGSPVPPPDPTGHAWSAVRLDDGQWKLLDPCWGAGHVQGKGQPYTRHFTPEEFTRSNAAFGRTHFPANPAHFFLPGGRTVSWAEYLIGDVPGGGAPVLVFSDVAPREGFDKHSFEPRQLHLDPTQLDSSGSGAAPGKVRFSFHRVCPHWDPYRQGPGAPYAYLLALRVPGDGKGQAGEYVGFQNDGYQWWADVRPDQLGRKGQKVFIYACTSVGGQEGRGIPYAEANWRKGMGWSGVAMWEVV